MLKVLVKVFIMIIHHYGRKWRFEWGKRRKYVKNSIFWNRNFNLKNLFFLFRDMRKPEWRIAKTSFIKSKISITVIMWLQRRKGLDSIKQSSADVRTHVFAIFCIGIFQKVVSVPGEPKSNHWKQAKYEYPFYPYGLSLNAYWKTGSQLLQRSLAHALLLDLEYTIKMYKKSINIYSPRLDSNRITWK